MVYGCPRGLAQNTVFSSPVCVSLVYQALYNSSWLEVAVCVYGLIRTGGWFAVAGRLAPPGFLLFSLSLSSLLFPLSCSLSPQPVSMGHQWSLIPSP